MKSTQKCETHDTEISKLKTDLTTTNVKLDNIISESDDFRNKINSKIDDIMIELKKPILTPYQSFALFFIVIGYMASIMIYGGNIKSDVRVNTINNDYTNTNVKEIKADVKEILKILK